MRSTPVRLLLAVAAAAVTATACGGKYSELPDSGPPDATVLPPDAMPLPDTPPILDAALPNCAETGETTVIVTGPSGTPVPDVLVLFSYPDGTVIGQTSTDADGRALTLLSTDAQITVAYQQGYPDRINRLITWTDVDPGACLRFVAYPDAGSSVGQVNVTLPGPFPGVAGGYFVQVAGRGNCVSYADPSHPTSIPITDQCVRDGAISIVAGALNISELLAFSTVDLPFSSGAIDVTLPPWRTNAATYDVSLANSGTDLLSVHFVLSPTRRGLPMIGLGYDLDAPAGWTYPISARVPATDLHDGFFEQATFGNPLVGATRHYVHHGRATGHVPVSIDGALLPAPVDSVLVDDPTAARPTISWAGAPVEHDFVWVEYLSSNGGEPAIVSGWHLMVDPARSSVQLPELPPSFSAFAPSVGQHPVYVTRVDSSSVSAYSEAIAQPLRGESLAWPIYNMYATYVLEPYQGDFTIQSATRSAAF